MATRKTKKSVDIPAASAAEEDYEVLRVTKVENKDNPSEEVSIITMTKNISEKAIGRALAAYDPENKQYSTVLGNTTSTETLTQSVLADLADNAQDKLVNIQKINAYIRKYINLDDIIGLVYASVNSNINTDFRLIWKDVGTKKKQQTTQVKAKEIIDDFNRQVNIRQFVRNSVMAGWTEGNFLCYLRIQDTNYVIDSYPLGLAEISDYSENGRPIVLINMDELKTLLRRTILKGVNGKALFFEDTLEEIKNNFGQEIYDAYNNKTKVKYCRLPTSRTGVIRVNNLRRKYGVSHIFRALPSALMLTTIQTADESVAKAKQKKIIHQIFRKEALGASQREMMFDQVAWAHENLLSAWKQPSVVVTTPPCVEKIAYVEPSVEDVSVDKQKLYRTKVLSSMGISFLTNDSSQTASTANMSWQMLSQMIDGICEQVEDMISDFYRTVLAENGVKDELYVPAVKIMNSELLSMDTRMALAKLVLGTFNGSLETALNYIGIDIEDEKERRSRENDEEIEKIFFPRGTAYTSPADSQNGDEKKTGRPKANTPANEDKQAYDNNYNKDGRK